MYLTQETRCSIWLLFHYNLSVNVMRGESYMEQIFDNNNLTDIEIALHILKLMDVYNKHRGTKNCTNGKTIYIEMTKNVLKTMTNPFAKKLLIDKIADQSNDLKL